MSLSHGRRITRIRNEQEGERESCRIPGNKRRERVEGGRLRSGRKMGVPRDMDAVRDHRSDMSGPLSGNGRWNFGSGARSPFGKTPDVVAALRNAQ